MFHSSKLVHLSLLHQPFTSCSESQVGASQLTAILFSTLIFATTLPYLIVRCGHLLFGVLGLGFEVYSKIEQSTEISLMPLARFTHTGSPTINTSTGVVHLLQSVKPN